MISEAKRNRIARARAKVERERQWIAEHGGNIIAYVNRYGDSDAPVEQRYGDGGQRIYEADMLTLREAERELELAEMA